jgi:hypothetical protein
LLSVSANSRQGSWPELAAERFIYHQRQKGSKNAVEWGTKNQVEWGIRLAKGKIIERHFLIKLRSCEGEM